MKAYGFGLAIVCLTLAAFESPRCAAQVNAPGRKLASELGDKLHILEPVAIDHKAHSENKADTRKIQVGDKVLICVSYDPVATPVKEVEVRFASKRMAACEIAKVPREPSKDKKDTSETFAVVVKATEANAAGTCVAVDCLLTDGTTKTLYFKFEIQPK